jgi:hypothetical protein
VHALHQPGAVQFRKIPANSVFGNCEMLAQLGRHDLAVTFENQEDFLPPQIRQFGCAMLFVHGFARLCVNLLVCPRLAKPHRKHKHTSQVLILSIFQITKPNFLFAPDLFKMSAITPVSDGNDMNINFAFACMIVVSFTIALVHT